MYRRISVPHIILPQSYFTVARLILLLGNLGNSALLLKKQTFLDEIHRVSLAHATYCRKSWLLQNGKRKNATFRAPPGFPQNATAQTGSYLVDNGDIYLTVMKSFKARGALCFGVQQMHKAHTSWKHQGPSLVCPRCRLFPPSLCRRGRFRRRSVLCPRPHRLPIVLPSRGVG